MSAATPGAVRRAGGRLVLRRLHRPGGVDRRDRPRDARPVQLLGTPGALGADVRPGAGSRRRPGRRGHADSALQPPLQAETLQRAAGRTGRLDRRCDGLRETGPIRGAERALVQRAISPRRRRPADARQAAAAAALKPRLAPLIPRG